MTLKEAPVRVCCFQRHWGAVCPDGLVMCCLCFQRFEIEDLIVEDGEVIDVCKVCDNTERRRNVDQPMETPLTGVWIVYGLEIMAYPLFISDDELTARRFVEKLGYYANVKFWEFGTEWSI